MTANDKVAYACGGVVVAGLLYLVLALIIKLVGVKRVMKFLPPVVTGPIIICIGLSLASSAVSNASTNWLIAIVALATIIVFNIWGKGMFKIIPILMGVLVSYVFAVVLNALGFTNPDGSAIISFAEVAADSWVGLPKFQLCKFDITSILVMAPIAIASMMEHIGDMSAISATVGENFIEDPGLHRTLMGDGLATAFAGLLGGPANTTYGENTGVLELSRVYDPRVIRLAAVFAVVLSFIPKFSAVISTMPTAIIGGVSFMLYGMISAIGVRNVVENRVDLTKSRNLIIAGVIFVCALGFSDGITFTVGGASITLTALAIAAIAGIVLNAILPGNDYEFGVNPKGDQSRGVYVSNSDNAEK
jgi:uracil permease